MTRSEVAGSEIAVTAFILHERVMAMNGRPDRGSLPGALRSYEFPVIGKGRRKILFAVEGAWPSDVSANAPIRREFGLPPSRPFLG